MANQDVKLKHKVQLRKKVEEENPVIQPEEVNTPHVEEPEVKKSSKSWIWWILGILVVLCVIIGVVVSKSGKSEEPVSEMEEVVTEDVVATPKDSIVNEQTSDNEPALTEETPAEPTTEEATPVAPAQPQPTVKENSTTSAAANVSSDVEAEAMKVIRGDYGIGQERKDKLGSQYQTIQNRVNELKREGIF